MTNRLPKLQRMLSGTLSEELIDKAIDPGNWPHQTPRSPRLVPNIRRETNPKKTLPLHRFQKHKQANRMGNSVFLGSQVPSYIGQSVLRGFCSSITPIHQTPEHCPNEEVFPFPPYERRLPHTPSTLGSNVHSIASVTYCQLSVSADSQSILRDDAP